MGQGQMANDVSLARGRGYVAIPGPSVVPDAVLRAMHRASPNIYGQDLAEMTASLFPDLGRVARTRPRTAIYSGNGHAAWEAALANTIAPGDRVLVLATGRFGHGWGQMAEGLGAAVETVDFGTDAPIDNDRVAEVLRADTAHRIKAVLAVHVDTSTSIRNDIGALRAAMDAAGHPALLMADCIASLACDRFEMDDWGVDVMVTGSQKGLMCPPGLVFVFFNDRADKVRARLERVSVYWDWAPRSAPEQYYQYFCGTAPTHHLYGLRAALDMIHDEGIEAIWARHAHLARAIWAAADVWAQDGPLRLNVAEPRLRSTAVTALTLGNGLGRDLRAWTETRIGLTLGVGFGIFDPDDPDGDGAFRIGHMGHVDGQMILAALSGIDAGLKALSIPHGAGALEAATQVLASPAPGQS
jgi:alanine-glyoxylate transaminase/serine-glyoxylate transaminase/serine-pyruvate transaminase